jgi:hypothetical protein
LTRKKGEKRREREEGVARLRTIIIAATGFGQAIALPFDGLGDIGLSSARAFRDSTSTLFEAAALFLFTAVRLGAAFGVRVWIVEAVCVGVCSWLVEANGIG